MLSTELIQVDYEQSDDIIELSWIIPDVYHSAVFIEQCHDHSVMPECVLYNVTYLSRLVVDASNGTRVNLLVYQDRDLVVQLPFVSLEVTTEMVTAMRSSEESSSGKLWCLKSIFHRFCVPLSLMSLIMKFSSIDSTRL